MRRLEIWGGVECSVVRVRDGVRDQLEETRHLHRCGDLDLIAELGIRTLRYPVLWEVVERERGQRDWSWPDQRLSHLSALGITPILGLLHHGSGPIHTNPLAADFPELFADYAYAVARRFPQFDYYTPINEPLTTARLSALYGHWFPHTCDEATFLRMVVAQCRAINKAMQAIRAINPRAKLIQTEDVGRVFSTEPLRYQAEHENERRWLGLDLLCGRVGQEHPFYGRLLSFGVDPDHLAELRDGPCPPDLLGLDFYLTSDRFLDHRVELNPGHPIGRNCRDFYVDVALPSSLYQGCGGGFLGSICDAWARYGIPLALTEVHNGSTQDEQLRWLMEAWNAANAARAIGIDVRAVTSWSLFGCVDWNSLLTIRAGFYESGAFDVRNDPPTATSIATAIRDLARTSEFNHPTLRRPGWWHERGARERREPASDVAVQI